MNKYSVASIPISEPQNHSKNLAMQSVNTKLEYCINSFFLMKEATLWTMPGKEE